jgi:hypothetical protein
MWRPSAILFCILLTASVARPGEITKTDDSNESGQIIAFDGKDLQLRKVYTNDSLVSIPVRDVTRVQFHEGRGPEDWIPQRIQGRLPDVWQCKLTTGDSVSGALGALSESQLKLRLQVDETVLKIPLPLVRDIWRYSPDLVRKALDLKTTSITHDVVYVYKDNDILAVQGTVTGIEGDQLRIIYEGEQKKINLDRLLGVVLAAQKRPSTTQPAGTLPHKLVLLNADVLACRWTRLENLKATFETSWGQTIEMRVEPIWRVEISEKNSDFVFLSSLKPSRVEQTPYFDRVIPWRADASLDGGPLRLNDGHQYPHGVSMHSRCILEYDIDGKYNQFTARLGFEPIPPNLPLGRVSIRILADGSPKFESPDFRSDSQPKDLTLDIRGAKRLTLEVDFGEGQDVNDRIAFANAKLIHSAGVN